MGVPLVVELLDKFHDLVNYIETSEGSLNDDAWTRAYSADPSMEWSDKMCTRRAIKFVKTLALCYYNADWSGAGADDADSLLVIKMYLEWLKGELRSVIKGYQTFASSWALSEIAKLRLDGARIYKKLAKQRLSYTVLDGSVMFDEFTCSVQQYLRNAPKKPRELNSAVEAHYNLTVQHLEGFMYVVSNQPILESRVGALIFSIIYVAHKVDVDVGKTYTEEREERIFRYSSDMSLKLSPHHNPGVVELCLEALSAKIESSSSQHMVHSFVNLLQSAHDREPHILAYILNIPMMDLIVHKLLEYLFNPVDHKMKLKLNLIKAQLHVMLTLTCFGVNEAATVGQALTFLTHFLKNPAEYMDDQQNVVLQLIKHFLRETSGSLGESSQIPEDVIDESSLAILNFYKADYFLTVFRHDNSHADFGVDMLQDRSFISFRELLSGTPENDVIDANASNEINQPVQINQLPSHLSSKNELNLEEIVAVYEQGSFSLYNVFVESGRVVFADHLMQKMRKLLTNKPESFALIEDQLVALLGELELLGSFLKDVEMKDAENQGICMRVRCLIYEAESILDMFLCGDAPVWYQQLLIFNAIQETKLIKAQIPEDSFSLASTSDDQAKIIVDLHKNETKHPNSLFHSLNEFVDGGAREYWIKYVYDSYILNPSVHWTDERSTAKATKFLKTIQFFYNTDRSTVNEDEQLAVQCQRRKNYLRCLQREIVECGHLHHLASALTDSLASIGLLRVKFCDIRNQLMKLPHPALSVDGPVFDEFVDSVQHYLMNVLREPVGWGLSPHDYGTVVENYRVSAEMMRCFRYHSFSKHWTDQESLQCILDQAVCLIFCVLQMAYNNDVEKTITAQMEENIFNCSSNIARKLLSWNRDAMDVYVEFLSANVKIISASKQSPMMKSLQSAKHHARILSEVLNEQVDGPESYFNFIL